MDSINIFGVKIHNTTLDETTKLVGEFLKGESLKVIYTPNTEIVMAAKDDMELKELLNRGDLIIPDGIGLIYGSRIQKTTKRDNGIDTNKTIEVAKK